MTHEAVDPAYEAQTKKRLDDIELILRAAKTLAQKQLGPKVRLAIGIVTLDVAEDNQGIGPAGHDCVSWSMVHCYVEPDEIHDENMTRMICASFNGINQAVAGHLKPLKPVWQPLQETEQ